MVRNVHYNNSSYGYLEEGDVILEIDGTKVNNNGTVSVRLNPNSNHHYRTVGDILVQQHHVGDEIQLKIRRKSELNTIRFPLKEPFDLVPRYRYDVSPTYYIYCGFVFMPLSVDYLETWKQFSYKAPKMFVHLYLNGYPTADSQQVVVLTKILDDEINMGYEEEQANTIVASVNGKPIANLEQMVYEIEVGCAQSDIFTLITTDNQYLVVPGPATKERKEATERIAATYGIPEKNMDRSDNLK